MNATTSHAFFHQCQQYDGLSALDAHNYTNKFAPHFHETYQITWNRSGIFKNHIHDKILQSWPASIAITHPKEVHTTICEQPQGHSFFTLYIPTTLFNREINNNDLPRFDHVVHDDQSLILMSQIQATLAQQKLPAEWLIFQLIKNLQDHHTKDELPTHYAGELTAYAKKYCLQPFNLSSWACQLGLDKFKLIRSFKAETGMTPNQFVIYQRIQKSLIDLRQGSTVVDAALANGFYDAAHYYKCFKKIMGVTPVTFQQALY